MARPDADILQLLANPTNRVILSVLAMEPQYPRRLAEVVGLTEDEASRRLRLFEKAGLAQAEWANVGKTVRLYRLALSDLRVSLTGAGITVTGAGDERAIELGSVGEEIPHPNRFVGRVHELAELTRLVEERRVVCIQALGGTGKTSLAATFASASMRPVVWHTVAPGESGTLLTGRLAAALRPLASGANAHRMTGLRANEEGNLLVDAILECINDVGALVVLDRFEAAGEGAGDAVARIAHGLTGARILITTRLVPREISRDTMAVYKLEGLNVEDTIALVNVMSPTVDAEVARGLHVITRGHALSIVLAGLAGPRATPRGLFDESGIRDFLVTDVLPQLLAPERDVLLALSLLRTPFTSDEAEAIADSRHARDALLRLEARGLVTRAGTTFSIHDLLRAVAADVSPEKRKVHKRAAETLRSSNEPLKILEALHHDLEADDLTAAGRTIVEEATRHTYRFADLGLVSNYRELLLRFEADKRAEPRALAACLIELAMIDLRTGDAVKVRLRIQTAERLLGKRTKTLEAQLLVATARLDHLTGKPQEASARFAQAEALAEETGDKPLLLSILLDHAFRDEEWSPGALALYERAIKVGEETSDIRLLSLAFSGAARMSAREGKKEALGWADEALRLAKLAGYPRGEADAYMTLTTHYMVTREVEKGFAHAARYLEVAELLGDPWLRACAINDIAFLLVTAGRFQEAVVQADRGIEFARSIQSVYYDSGARLAKAEALLRLGRTKEARDALPTNLETCLASWPALAARGWRTAGDILESTGERDAAAHAYARATALDPSASPMADAPVRKDRRSHMSGP